MPLLCCAKAYVLMYLFCTDIGHRSHCKFTLCDLACSSIALLVVYFLSQCKHGNRPQPVWIFCYVVVIGLETENAFDKCHRHVLNRGENVDA